MITLSASNSLFELAFAVNAVLPHLLSEFDRVKGDIADSMLKKIREVRPMHDLRERDRLEYVDFVFRSSKGLRFGWLLTVLVVGVSLALCATSLGALVWSAANPSAELADRDLYLFVTLAFFFAPTLYLVRDRFLRWLYVALVEENGDQVMNPEFLARCADSYLSARRTFRRLEAEMEDLNLIAERTIWNARLSIWHMRLTAWRNKLRSWFKRL